MVRWHDNGLEGLTFDDVLLRPRFSDLSSRLDSDPYERLKLNNRDQEISPIMVANMATTATISMKCALGPHKLMVPAHRFQAIPDELAHIKSNFSPFNAGTIGLHDRERTDEVCRYTDLLFLELAHAHSRDCISEIKYIRDNWPKKFIVVGNVATADGCKRLFDAGADMVKVGIGPGAVCTTRLVTGCGVPQLSAILECAAYGPIIADGGIRNSGDIVKALAAGAKFVMVGSLFAGTDEAAGEVIEEGGTRSKIYYGMASRDAGKVREGCVPEGITSRVRYTGRAVDIATNLVAGVRQGLALVGARNLDDLRQYAVFQRVSQATIIENQPHIQFRS